MMGNYVGIEVVPVANDDSGDGCHVVTGTEVAEYWGVYGRMKDGRAVWVLDMPARETAITEAERVSKGMKVPIIHIGGSVKRDTSEGGE